MSTNPEAEQRELKRKNEESNGLLIDTCRQIRFLRDTYFESEHLPVILIDAFTYHSIDGWHWRDKKEILFEEKHSNGHPYEDHLLSEFQKAMVWGGTPHWPAPGSMMRVDTSENMRRVLGEILKMMAQQ